MAEAENHNPETHETIRTSIEEVEAGIVNLEHHVSTSGVERIPFLIPENATALFSIKSYADILRQRRELVERLSKYTLPYARVKSELLQRRLAEFDVPTDAVQDENELAPQDLELDANDSVAIASGPMIPLEKRTSIESVYKTVPLATPTEGKKATPRKPTVNATPKAKAVKPDPNLVVIDLVNATVSASGKRTPMLHPGHYKLMEKVAAQDGRATLSDLLTPDELSDTATVMQMELSLKRMVTDLEKDPSNPQTVVVTGSGKSLSIRVLRPIHLINKNE